MKVKLVVAQGVHEGKEIPIVGPQFVIGRDPQCQLRPSSPAISKRHCAILVRGNKVFLRDFGSTNGTFADGQPVQGEVELVDKEHIKAGPLEFRISIEAAVATPLPKKPEPAAAKPKADSDDDFAALLLDGDESTPGKVPDGSTIMEMGAIKPLEDPAEKKEAPKPEAKKPEADTRSAAADILKLYQRRPRS